MTKVPMTMAGATRLREELQRLEGTDRREVINAISEARKHGDLKENAEYHAAKERQGFIEGRIIEIKDKLSRCHVIDVTRLEKSGRVVFGATIELVNNTNDETVNYQIVGEDEADIKHAKISVNSPIARALIGKEEGDVVKVTTPSGDIEYEVVSVEYI